MSLTLPMLPNPLIPCRRRSSLLAVVGLAGGYVPARRAAKLDPVATLRHD